MLGRKSKTILLFLILILIPVFSSGCYTKIKLISKTSPKTWQKVHHHEINHVVDCPSCFKWDYYYHYPYWINYNNGKRTGYDRIATFGELCWDGIVFSINIMNLCDWSDDDDDNDDKEKNGSHKLPGKRDKGDSKND